MLLLLAITRYTNNCITVHRLHSDYEALPLRVNKHIVQFHSTVFIIIDISTLDTTGGTRKLEVDRGTQILLFVHLDRFNSKFRKGGKHSDSKTQ